MQSFGRGGKLVKSCFVTKLGSSAIHDGLPNLHQNVHWAVRYYFLNDCAHDAFGSLVGMGLAEMLDKFV